MANINRDNKKILNKYSLIGYIFSNKLLNIHLLQMEQFRKSF